MKIKEILKDTHVIWKKVPVTKFVKSSIWMNYLIEQNKFKTVKVKFIANEVYEHIKQITKDTHGITHYLVRIMSLCRFVCSACRFWNEFLFQKWKFMRTFEDSKWFSLEIVKLLQRWSKISYFHLDESSFTRYVCITLYFNCVFVQL